MYPGAAGVYVYMSNNGEQFWGETILAHQDTIDDWVEKRHPLPILFKLLQNRERLGLYKNQRQKHTRD